MLKCPELGLKEFVGKLMKLRFNGIFKNIIIQIILLNVKNLVKY